mgnify:CR=1 FL=1
MLRLENGYASDFQPFLCDDKLTFFCRKKITDDCLLLKKGLYLQCQTNIIF